MSRVADSPPKPSRSQRTDPDTGKAFKGSQRWLQCFVEDRPDALQPEGLPPLTWVSPVARDKYREYSDGAFLDRLGLAHLGPGLTEFWPRGGAVWDGLARFEGGVVLVEAKAHIAEFLSPGSSAKPASMERISASLSAARSALGAAEVSDWSRVFYQYANRLAHLWWLREQGVDAKLLLVGFVGDASVDGPTSREAWAAAYLVADHALGLPKRSHPLRPHIMHVSPDVREL